MWRFRRLGSGLQELCQKIIIVANFDRTESQVHHSLKVTNNAESSTISTTRKTAETGVHHGHAQWVDDRVPTFQSLSDAIPAVMRLAE
jgi:hypothetical protein